MLIVRLPFRIMECPQNNPETHILPNRVVFQRQRVNTSSQRPLTAMQAYLDAVQHLNIHCDLVAIESVRAFKLYPHLRLHIPADQKLYRAATQPYFKARNHFSHAPGLRS